MLLQVLRALEGLATEVAFVRFQRYVDTDMRGDMIALDGGGSTIAPLTSEVKIVCALATDMALANMVLDENEVNSVVVGSSRWWIHSRRAAPRSPLSLHSHSTDIATSRDCRLARASMVPAAVAAVVVVVVVAAAPVAAAAVVVAAAVR